MQLKTEKKKQNLPVMLKLKGIILKTQLCIEKFKSDSLFEGIMGAA